MFATWSSAFKSAAHAAGRVKRWSPHASRIALRMSVMRLRLLFELTMKENKHSTGCWLVGSVAGCHGVVVVVVVVGARQKRRRMRMTAATTTMVKP